MRRLLAFALIAAVSHAAVAQFPATDSAAPAQHRPPATSAAASAALDTRFQRDMDTGMARMMQDMHAAPTTGNVDVDFLAMMIPHHAGAVDMARLVLQHGHDPVTRQMAEEIIAGQTTEIDSMTRRLQSLRAGRSPGSAAEFPALGGTRGP